MARKKLSAKRQRFVHEYLIDLNAAGAYKRAGYVVKNDHLAAVEGARLLTNPDVAAAISAAQAKLAKKLEVNAESVLREYCRIAFSDIGQVFDDSGQIQAVKDIPEDARRAVSSIKVRRVIEGSGDDAEEIETVEFKLWDKLNALEKLAKHLGLLKDQVELTGPNGKPVQITVVEVIRESSSGQSLPSPEQQANP